MSTADMLRTTMDAIKSRKIHAFDAKECNLRLSDQPIPKPLLGYFYRRPEHDDPAKKCLNIEYTLQYKNPMSPYIKAPCLHTTQPILD